MKDLPNLKDNGIDYFVSTTKSAVGAVPVFGNAISEIVGVVIPNQRMDRVVRYLQILEKRVTRLEKNDALLSKMQDKQFTLLFERSIIYASETESEIIHGCYAACVIASLESKETQEIHQERILEILSKLNEHEIILLIYHSFTPTIGMKNKFIEKYNDIIRRPLVTMGAEELLKQRGVFYDQYIDNLENIGLIKRNISVHRETGIPTVKHGEFQKEHVYITSLGRLISTCIGSDQLKDEPNFTH